MNTIYIGSPKENALYIFSGSNYQFTKKIGGATLSGCIVPPFGGLGNSIATDKFSDVYALGAYLTTVENFTSGDGAVFLQNEEVKCFSTSECGIVNQNTLSVITNFPSSSSFYNPLYCFQQFISGSGIGSNYYYTEAQTWYYNPSYGLSIDINDNSNVIILGGPWDKTNGIDAEGAAMIFTGNEIDGWGFKQKIIGPTNNRDSSPKRGAYYGEGVSINNDGTVIAMLGPNDSIEWEYDLKGSLAFYTGNPTLGWVYSNQIASVSAPAFFTPLDAASTQNFIFSYPPRNCRFVMSNDAKVVAVSTPLVNSNGFFNSTITIYTGSATGTWMKKNTFQSQSFYYAYDSIAFDMNSDGTIIVAGSISTKLCPADDCGRTVINNMIFTGNAQQGWAIKQIISGNNEIGDLSTDAWGGYMKISSDGSVIILGNERNYTSNAYIYNTGLKILTGNKIDGWKEAQRLPVPAFSDYYSPSADINEDGSVIVISRDSSTLIITGNKNIGVWAPADTIFTPIRCCAPVRISNNGNLILNSYPKFGETAVSPYNFMGVGGALIYKLCPSS